MKDYEISEIEYLKKRNKRLTEELRRNKKHKKDWFTMSKIITYFVSVSYAIVIFSSLYPVFAYNDTSSLPYLIPSTGVVAAVGVKAYFDKSKLEFKLNKMNEMGIKPESSDFNFEQ